MSAYYVWVRSSRGTGHHEPAAVSYDSIFLCHYQETSTAAEAAVRKICVVLMHEADKQRIKHPCSAHKPQGQHTSFAAAFAQKACAHPQLSSQYLEW